jgi:hypothetical protein
MPLKKIALAAAVTALVWAGCCLALALHSGLPEPAIHDEFSYLMGADTFLHGRLANPSHPMHRFFEAPHILMEPRYASKYPPGQALILALGKKLFGEPWYGVLLSGALMMFLITMVCAARASLWPGVAVATLVGLVFLPPMYWTYSYWGGCLAAGAGAAVLLSVDFYRRGLAAAAGLIFAAGILTLFVTRPYEGGVFTLAVIIADGFWLYRERGKSAFGGLRGFLPAAVPVIVAGFLWCGFYNAAVTGHLLQLPHSFYDEHFNEGPIFWLLPARPELHLTNARLAALQSRGSAEFQMYSFMHSAGFINALFMTLKPPARLFGWSLAPLLLVPFAWRDWRIRPLILLLFLSLFGLSLTTFHFSHYAAPVIAAIAALSACGTESVWRLRIRSIPVGAIMAAAAFSVALSTPLPRITNPAAYSSSMAAFGDTRARIISAFSQTGGEQLIIVRYANPVWQPDMEWVYNSADIDSQRIIFAHDLGAQENAALVQYYAGRRIWLLTQSDTTVRVEPYIAGI